MAKKFTSNKKSLAEALAEFIEYGLSTKNYNGEIALVKSVNATLKTCEVETTEGVIIEDVLLEQLQSNNGLFVSPKIGSTVIIDYLDEVSAYVSMFSEIDTIVFQNGDNGGLTITPELKSQLDIMTNRIDAVIDAIKGGVPIAQDGGVGLLASQTLLLDAIVIKEDFSNIENENFKH